MSTTQKMIENIDGKTVKALASLVQARSAELQQALIKTLQDRVENEQDLRGCALQNSQAVTKRYSRAVIESGQMAADEAKAVDLVINALNGFKTGRRVWRHSFGYLYRSGGFARHVGDDVHAVLDINRDFSVVSKIRKAGGRAGYALNSGWVD